MRILFVVPNVPSLIRTRPFNFIRELSRIHEVSVLCLATNESDDQFASELKRYCHSLDIIRLPRWRSLSNCLLALFSSKSLRCAYFYSPSLRERVKAMVDSGGIDLVHVEHLKSVLMVEDAIGKVPVVSLLKMSGGGDSSSTHFSCGIAPVHGFLSPSKSGI